MNQSSRRQGQKKHLKKLMATFFPKFIENYKSTDRRNSTNPTDKKYQTNKQTTFRHIKLNFWKPVIKRNILKADTEKKTQYTQRNKDKNIWGLSHQKLLTQKNTYWKGRQNKNFSDLWKLEDFLTSRFALQEILKESFR